MTPIYDLNQFSTIEEDHDHDHDQGSLHQFTLSAHDHYASSLSCPIFFSNSQAQGANDTTHDLFQQQTLHQLQQHGQQKQQFMDHIVIQGPSNLPVSIPTETNGIDEGSICYQEVRDQEDEQVKSSMWMSSKMRIMRKMMNRDGMVTRKPRRSRDQQHPLQSNSNNSSGNSNNSPADGFVRVCSDCNTTKTPLWRSGPSGPKTLCNACGIRQRKARRALAAAAAVNGALIPKITPNKVQNDDISGDHDDDDRMVPFKKRCRFSSAVQKKQKKKKKRMGSFDDIVISLSKSSAFHQVFPQDEKDAAILLMALSCGLICS